MNRAWRRIATLACALSVLAASAAAQQKGSLGLGVLLGNPSGLTVKDWLDKTTAIDGGVGFNGDVVYYADALFHSWDLLPQPSRGALAAYVGMGGRLQDDSETQFGIRTIAGVSYWPETTPIEIFAEVGPVFQIAPDHFVDADGGIGVRFYFGMSRGGASAR